ncbi:MAG TPA: PrsW family glutamic-type intramembrane protease [Holophagaceae bacterium]|nr:PrsW family glutamic-type intramembrane protease [Holophagaceae bacterium]
MDSTSTTGTLIRILLGLLPVSLFLCGLVYLDSYKLVRLRRILALLAAGCLSAVLSYALNRLVLVGAGIDHGTLARFIAPPLEEMLKGLPVLLLLRWKRAGFLVDAAIFGFGVGTGFALVENLYYCWALPDASLALWVVRGMGTAVMHGGTTAILAMATKLLYDRREAEPLWLVLPGLLLAAALHLGFNQFLLSPMLSAVLVVLILPPLMAMVFSQSERLLQAWLGSGFDLDSQLLEAIHSGAFGETRPGRYLQSLREHFEGAALADMLCYLRLHAELSMRAKGILMMRESGFPVARDPELDEQLAELAYLRKSLGRTGLLALAPVLQRSDKDLWQMSLLDEG